MPPLLQFSIPSRLRWQACLFPLAPPFVLLLACSQNTGIFFCVICLLLLTGPQRLRAEASGIPSTATGNLVLWEARLPHASSSPWPHPCSLTCLNTEEAPEPVAEEALGLRCLGNGDGSCCFLPGAALVRLRLRAGKWPPLPQGRKL